MAEATQTDQGPGGPLPEFSLVVRHPGRRGPLGPHRLTIAVAVVAVVLGPALYAMLSGQIPDDSVFLRAGAIGFLAWMMVGIVDAALGSAEGAVQRSESNDAG